jgi:hypothetical protein
MCTGFLVGNYNRLEIDGDAQDKVQTTVIVDQFLNISHDLSISAMRACRHLVCWFSVGLEHRCGLRV